MFKNSKITGIGIDSDVYHKRDPEIPRGNPEYVMSQGELMNFAINAHRWKAGYKEDQEGTKSTEWGSLIDCLILDADRFEEKYAVTPETYPAPESAKKNAPIIDKPWNWNANHCKDWKKEQGIKEVIKPDMLKDSDLAVKVLSADEIILEVLSCSAKQVMVISEWHDKETALIIPCRILLDIVPDKNNPLYGQMLGDFKTARSANQRAWSKQIFDYNYHVQGAFYTDIYESATEENRTDFFYIIQENYHPYETGRRILTHDFMEEGRYRYQAALKNYCQCLKTGFWPGYDDNERNQIHGFTFVEPEAYMVKGD